MVAHCPIDWSFAILARIKVLKDLMSQHIDSGGVKAPPKLAKEYKLLTETLPALGIDAHSGRRARTIHGGDHRRDVLILRSLSNWADVICQSVNNQYMGINDALKHLKKKDVFGVSISRDHALFPAVGKTTVKSVKVAWVYNRNNPVGRINLKSGIITPNPKFGADNAEYLQLTLGRRVVI
jgi:hypothetical protein